MAKKHSNYAMDLEGEAYSTRSKARYLEGSERYSGLLEAAKLYEKAAGEWARELTANKDFPRVVVNARNNMRRDYGLGKVIRKEMKKMGFAEKMPAMAEERPVSPFRRYSTAIASILSLLGALVFVSLNLTGNAVGAGLGDTDAKLIGLVLFVCGLLFAFMHFNKKKFKF